jgi:flagellar basal-body rod modification protein FlgD
MIDGVGSSTNTNATDTKTSLPADRMQADKDMFLKLLVAQLRNQDPLQPQDGIQFITQLAQFTSLEHSASMREDLTAIRTALQAAEGTTANPDSTETNS